MFEEFLIDKQEFFLRRGHDSIWRWGNLADFYRENKSWRVRMHYQNLVQSFGLQETQNNLFTLKQFELEQFERLYIAEKETKLFFANLYPNHNLSCTIQYTHNALKLFCPNIHYNLGVNSFLKLIPKNSLGFTLPMIIDYQLQSIGIKRQTFQTKSQVITFLYEVLATHLPSIYNKTDYQKATDMLQAPHLYDFTIPNIQKLWWIMFIDPKNDLTKIF